MKLTATQKLLGILVFGAVGFMVLYFSYQPQYASANPSQFCIDSTAAATTTVTYMKPGLATTTLQFNNCGGSPPTDAIDSALAQIIFQASTTAPVLKARVEHSYNGIDWYPENDAMYVATTPVSLASTTVQTTPFHDYSFTLSTTTTDTAGTGAFNRVHVSLNVNTPTPYNRIIISMPTGGGEGSLYLQVVGKKQRR